MAAYYNEHDAKAAAWLREVISRGHIAAGDVDERSVADVQPDDLRGFTQCHFFAGVGVWSYALRGAGWPDDAPVWTGSCPCQPFSASGKGAGTDDHRHLWPAWFRLIRECQPNVCFGEQVASAAGLAWFDFVSADLESAGYAVGAADTCAAGVGAPHIRQRLYFVADAKRGATERHGHAVGGAPGPRVGEARQQRIRPNARDGGGVGLVADSEGGNGRLPVQQRRPGATGAESERRSEARELADADSGGRNGRPARERWQARDEDAGCRGGMGNTDGPNESTARLQRSGQLGRVAEDVGAGATGGFWGDAEWITCRDGKARPIEPGTFPLAHGAPARVGRLRGYGNAIVAPQAIEFIAAYLDIVGA